MPVFVINTNVPQTDITNHLLHKLVDVVADSLAKPKTYVVVQVIGGQSMCWGGRDASCATGRLTSIGAVNRANNERLQRGVADLLKHELGIAPEFLYITFEDVAPVNLGWKQGTFADIFG